MEKQLDYFLILLSTGALLYILSAIQFTFVKVSDKTLIGFSIREIDDECSCVDKSHVSTINILSSIAIIMIIYIIYIIGLL